MHELLGHGSGKLFHRGTPDADALVASRTAHPLTGEPISGPFYAPGATWDSTFGKLASAYEECRAECAGVYRHMPLHAVTRPSHARYMAVTRPLRAECSGIHL